jgi:hypothetical protein
MALLASQRPVPTGLATAYTNAGNHTFTPTRHQVLIVKNGSGVSVTVTIPTPQQYRGVDVSEITVAVPAAGERAIALDPELVTNPATGLGSMSFSATASVTVAVIEVP